MIGFPTPDPESFIPARIEADRALDQAPTWSLQTLLAITSRPSPAHEPHLLGTVGSDYAWGDEIRFDRRTGLLRSLLLKTPEEGAVAPALAASWLALPRRPGLPAISRTTGFNFDPLDLRLLTEEGRHLIVLLAETAAPDPDAVRLAIHADCDLLFARGRYCGWVLHDPVAHMVVAHRGDAPAGSAADDPELIGLLRDYLALVIQPNIDRMYDRDPELHAALEALLGRARACRARGPAPQTLATRIADVLDNFYE